jgi:uncharacterized protein with GYD domain
MPTYVTLFKWSDQGAKDVKNAPARFEAAKQLTVAMEGPRPVRHNG